MSRAFTAPCESERCTANVTLADGSGAACMHRRSQGTDRCWQHPRVYSCPFCEHMPDGAEVRLCATHTMNARIVGSLVVTDGATGIRTSQLDAPVKLDRITVSGAGSVGIDMDDSDKKGGR